MPGKPAAPALPPIAELFPFIFFAYMLLLLFGAFGVTGRTVSTLGAGPLGAGAFELLRLFALLLPRFVFADPPVVLLFAVLVVFDLLPPDDPPFDVPPLEFGGPAGFAAGAGAGFGSGAGFAAGAGAGFGAGFGAGAAAGFGGGGGAGFCCAEAIAGRKMRRSIRAND